MIGNTYVELKPLKNSFSKLSIHCYNNKGTRKIKDFQKLSNKEIYFTLQYNSTKYNFLDGHHILSPDIWGKTFNDWSKKCSDGYIFSIWYKLIHFFLHSNPTIHRIGNAPNILCLRYKAREESHTHFMFYCKLSKTTPDFISELINLNYFFNVTFKISLKAIIMGASSQFYAGIELKILPTLLEVFLRHLSYCGRQAFHDDGYDKINELFECNLVSCFNKIRDTATKLKIWDSLLNNNGNLNLQFN